MNPSKKNWYLTQFDLFDKNGNGKKNATAAAIRDQARNIFSSTDFPTTDDESWKYTNLSPMLQYNFSPAFIPDATQERTELIRDLFMNNSSRMVFINGWMNEGLSSIQNIPKKAVVKNISEAVRSHPDLAGEFLGKQSLAVQKPFPALNLSMLNDGAFIYLPDGSELTEPLHLIFYTVPGGRTLLNQPFVQIVAGDNTRAGIIIHTVGLPGEVYLSNAVTEVIAGKSSKIEIANIQYESMQSFHIHSLFMKQSSDSLLSHHAFSFGSSLTRNDVLATLEGKNGECVLNGLFTIAGQQHSDHSTVIDHAKPDCRSREVYKGILNGKSTGAFNGKIIVRPDSQRTDAKQSNNNLLLSKDATMNTRPQLEIFADDVKCTHGATIGRIYEAALFYMRSRGIDLFRAQAILTKAFAMQLVDALPWPSIRQELDNRIASHFNFRN